MRQTNRELWMALIAIAFITLIYLLMINQLGGIPVASGFYGHSMGILGFILMLMTETLYSIRKRSRSARWGKMSSWLQFHIFTGLVGPYMVLLHTSWKFNGLCRDRIPIDGAHRFKWCGRTLYLYRCPSKCRWN